MRLRARLETRVDDVPMRGSAAAATGAAIALAAQLASEMY